MFPGSVQLNTANDRFLIFTIETMKCIFSLFFSTFVISTAKGDCEKGCDSPINIYEQLKCIPKYEQATDCCPKEYDCSNIFNRREGTCHLRGKLYKPDEVVSNEELAESCFENCVCTKDLEFKCFPPMKSCREYHVPNYPKEGCYLKYPLDSCCASGQACPPFDDVATCEVNGKIYKEGERFPHPEKKCTKCVCDKNFDGKFREPACQHKNCSTEIKYSKQIDKHCAPYYISSTCCPTWWICPSEGGQYIPSPTTETSVLQCKFGEKMIGIGGKYIYQDAHTAKLICECVVPPFLSCFEQPGE